MDGQNTTDPADDLVAFPDIPNQPVSLKSIVCAREGVTKPLLGLRKLDLSMFPSIAGSQPGREGAHWPQSVITPCAINELRWKLSCQCRIHARSSAELGIPHEVLWFESETAPRGASRRTGT